MMQLKEATHTSTRRLEGLVKFFGSNLDLLLGYDPDAKYNAEFLADCYKSIPRECKTLKDHILQWPFMHRSCSFVWKIQYRCRGIYLRCKRFLVPYVRKLEIDQRRLVVALFEYLLGPNDPLVATSLQKLAERYYQAKPHWLQPSTEEFAKAELLLWRSLEIREKVLEPNDKDLDRSLFSLAECYFTQKKYTEAELFYKRLSLRRERAIGRVRQIASYLPSDLVIAWCLFQIAQSSELQKKKLGGEQEPLLRRSLAIREKVLGQNHPDVYRTLVYLACCLMCQGKHEGNQLMERADEMAPKDRTKCRAWWHNEDERAYGQI